MSTSAILPLAASGAAAAPATKPATTGTKTPPADPSGGLASQTVFLQLLIAQLKHQDPSNPADGTQFVTQLAQFTTLEQTTQSRADLDQMLKAMLAAAPTTPAANPVPANSN